MVVDVVVVVVVVVDANAKPFFSYVYRTKYMEIFVYISTLLYTLLVVTW